MAKKNNEVKSKVVEVKEVKTKETKNKETERELALNQEFRPVDIQSVVGQEDVKELLINSIRTNKIENSYIFYGPKGVSKTTMARAFAKTLNCYNPIDGVKPCGKCNACIDFQKDPGFAGVIEIDAGSQGRVDDIKDLISRLTYSPKHKYTVVIIDEGHNLTGGSENALLKICEEPPEWVVFIFATTNKDAIIDTIQSRSFLVKFTGIEHDKIKNHLSMICTKKNISIEDDALESICKVSDGCMRDAIKYLGQASAKYPNKTINIDDLVSIIPIEPKFIEELYSLIFQKESHALLSKMDEVFNDKNITFNKEHIDFFLNRIRINLYDTNTTKEFRDILLDILKIFISEKERLVYNTPIKIILECALFTSFNKYNEKCYTLDNNKFDNIPNECAITNNDSSSVSFKKIDLFAKMAYTCHSESDLDTLFKKAKIQYSGNKNILYFLYENKLECDKANIILRKQPAQYIKKVCQIDGFIVKAI